MTGKQIKETLIFFSLVVSIVLIVSGTAALVANDASQEQGAVITLYDDGCIRVIERAGDILCYQDGHAVDCISRGLKKR